MMGLKSDGEVVQNLLSLILPSDLSHWLNEEGMPQVQLGQTVDAHPGG